MDISISWYPSLWFCFAIAKILFPFRKIILRAEKDARLMGFFTSISTAGHNERSTGYQKLIFSPYKRCWSLLKPTTLVQTSPLSMVTRGLMPCALCRFLQASNCQLSFHFPANRLPGLACAAFKSIVSQVSGILFSWMISFAMRLFRRQWLIRVWKVQRLLTIEHETDSP